MLTKTATHHSIPSCRQGGGFINGLLAANPEEES
jgi:hypothetical protein